MLWITPAVFGQTTQLRNDFCGATLPALGTNIYADAVPSAQAYRFRIVNQANSATFIFDSSNRWFNLISAGANPVNNQTYEVEVAVNMGSGFGSYGTMCLVNTPVVVNPTTQLRDDFCNQTIASIGTNIFADFVLEAIAYRFRIVNQATNATIIFDSPNRWFNLIAVGANPVFYETYQVDVAINTGSGFGSYGTPCFVNTPNDVFPTTQVREDYCGITVPALGTNIPIVAIPQAIAYRVRVFNQTSNSTITFDTPNNFFNLVLAGVSPIFNETYVIDVAVDMGIGFGPYGSACSVFTPFAITPITQLRVDFCGAVIPTLGTNIFADEVVGAVTYRFRSVNQNTGVITVFDSPTRWFNLVNAGANPQLGQSFSITVAVNIGQGFGAYGSACVVNTQPVPLTPTTKIRNDFCGVYLPALGTNIFADNVIGAQMYRFRIKNVVSGVTITYDRNVRFFNLILAGASPQIAQQYEIDVAVNMGSGFGNYGASCFVFTPHIAPTQIEAFDCGSTKDMLFYEYIQAVPSAQAEMYQFRIRNGAFESISIVTNDPQIRFFDFPAYAYNTAYDVDVRIRFNGVWGPWGSSCIVSTVAQPYTQLQTNQFGGNNNCGATLPSVSSTIYAFGIPLVQTYKFRVTRNTYIDSVVTNVRSFKLTDLPNFSSNIEFGVPYSVEVAVQINGDYTPYGVQCDVFTPSPITQLRADFCGATLTTVGQNIFANAVTGAQQYRFEIDNGNGITEFTSNNRWFSLVNAGVAAPNTLYTIRVAIGVNGDFYPYGAACTVQTPPSVMMQENIGVQEATTEDTEELLFSVMGENELTASHADSKRNVALLDFQAYPNPANNHFQLLALNADKNYPIQISILDASGALVSALETNTELLGSLRLGMNLSPGVYFVRILSNEQSKVLRIIKN
jgi:hypothetical protein